MSKKLTLEQIFYGEESFQGTKNFGIGNKRQMATDQDESVKKIVDQEQLENFDDMLDFLSIRQSEYLDDMDEQYQPTTARGLPSDGFYKNLPGYNRVNSLADLINDFDEIDVERHREELESQRKEQEELYQSNLEEYKTLIVEPPERDNGAKPVSNHLAHQVDYLDLPTQDDTRTGTMSSIVSPKKFVPNSLQEIYSDELF